MNDRHNDIKCSIDSFNSCISSWISIMVKKLQQFSGGGGGGCGCHSGGGGGGEGWGIFTFHGIVIIINCGYILQER